MEIKIVEKVLGANDAMAAQNRAWFQDKGVFVINVMSSPGSGKTTLLEATLAALSGKLRAGVIVGDIATTYDSERLARSGAPVVQINTEPFGGDCHLAAHVVREALSGLDLDALDLIIIENVGNLVCPAEFDLGEAKKVVVLSVAEGEDKPVKYPLMFRVCDVAILNKVDLLPHLDYDKQLALRNISSVHPGLPVFETSAKTGQGLDQWLAWLTDQVKTKQ